MTLEGYREATKNIQPGRLVRVEYTNPFNVGKLTGRWLYDAKAPLVCIIELAKNNRTSMHYRRVLSIEEIR